jgi:predicted dehydrogenase
VVGVTRRTLLRVAVIGTGFVGPHHVDAVRRGGFGQVVALGGAEPEQLAACAQALGIDRATTDVAGLIADPTIDVIHICTPNATHVSLATAAIESGKHVVVEKPLALDSASASTLTRLAHTTRRHSMVSFTYRGYPMVQRARALVAEGQLGSIRLVHGRYLQDWLARASDYNWRVDTGIGGPSRAVADIGAHWFDAVEYVTGLRIEAVFADLATVIARRAKPDGSTSTFAAANGGEMAQVSSEDVANLLVRFEGGALGACVVSQVSHGHHNDFSFELTGSLRSLAWQQEHPETLWFASRDDALTLTRGPREGDDTNALGVPALPAGHPEGWGGALRDLFRPFYAAIASGEDPVDSASRSAYPTLADGTRAVEFVEAALASGKKGGWALMPGSADASGDLGVASQPQPIHRP